MLAGAAPVSRRPTERRSGRRLRLLGPDLVGRILDEAFELLRDPGVRVQDAEARRPPGRRRRPGRRRGRPHPDLARRGRAGHGARPRSTCSTGPASPAVRYGAGVVQFDPGSSGVNVLDPVTGDHRPSQADDLVRLVRVAEMLPAYAAQSTAIVCNDVPAEIGDLYRLFLVLLGSAKPIVTGAFSPLGTAAMIDLLALDAGGREALAARPRAVFDVCPSPPLTWTAFGARNLVDLARARVPAEMVSMPLAGGAAPVTLVGSVVQHAAECLAGIAIHQLAAPGRARSCGAAPRRSSTCGPASRRWARSRRRCSTPRTRRSARTSTCRRTATSAATDGKVIDHQAGLESGMGALVGALAGIDMISGAGMLDSLRCQSAEKLVLDAEGIAMAQRLLRGIATPTETLATAMIRAAGPEARFLELAGDAAALPLRAGAAVGGDRPGLAAGLGGRRPAGRRGPGPAPRRGAAGGLRAAGARPVRRGGDGRPRAGGRRPVRPAGELPGVAAALA